VDNVNVSGVFPEPAPPFPNHLQILSSCMQKSSLIAMQALTSITSRDNSSSVKIVMVLIQLTKMLSVTVGTSSVTIPAGSFLDNNGEFEFEDIIGGVHVMMKIKEIHPDVFAFMVEAEVVDLTDTSNPVNIELIIGDDTGSTETRLKGVLMFGQEH